MKKLKPETWAEANSTRSLSQAYPHTTKTKLLAKQRANNALAKVLKAHGWTFRESVFIYETGYTLGFIKPTGFVARGAKNERPNPFPYLYFQWYWDNQGRFDFWNGEIHTFYNYVGDIKTRSPYATFEVKNILRPDLKNLDYYERQLIHALASQHPLR